MWLKGAFPQLRTHVFKSCSLSVVCSTREYSDITLILLLAEEQQM